MKSHQMSPRSWPALALACAVWTAGCTSGAEAPGPVDAEVEPGQVEKVSATEIEVDSLTDVGLPSGVLTLGLAPRVASVSTESGELTPSPDTTLVGVSWSFTPHSSSEARAVLLGDLRPESLPQPTVALTDGSRALTLPVLAQAGQSGAVVAGAEAPASVEVTFDGLTQTVDLATGAVGPGQADSLIDLGEATTSRPRICAARDFPVPEVLDNSCSVDAVHRLPYLSGLGWAPDAGTWLVVDTSVEGRATVLLDEDPGTLLARASQDQLRVAYAVAADATDQRIDFDYGPRIGVISVPLAD